MINKKENERKKNQDTRKTLENEDIGAVSHLFIKCLIESTFILLQLDSFCNIVLTPDKRYERGIEYK